LYLEHIQRKKKKSLKREAIEKNTTLRTLYVNNNKIDSPGMTAIAEALKNTLVISWKNNDLLL
jgi:hypothetical protein